jgi:DNA-binding response OmpR family regulator
MNTNKISDISILIAEDENLLLHSMTEYLELFFTHVYSAENGMDAYQIYLEKRPKIIIADIHMPRLDGLAMIRKIRKRDLETRIIITSAHSDKEKLMEAIELHLVKYLIKPIQSNELKELLLLQVDALRKKRETILLKEGYYWEGKQKKLWIENKEIELKPRERKALELLAQHANESVSSIEIYNHIYEDQPQKDYSSNAITSLMKRLRQKLPKETLKSSYGIGYILKTL